VPPYYDGWDVVRLDIDAVNEPDLLMDALDIRTLGGENYDAAFGSHLLEHIYPADLERFLLGVYRALAPDGFVEFRVPDALAACRAAAEAGTMDAFCYQSSAGPVTAWDMLYGHLPYQLRFGAPMAHHNGFDQAHLVATLDLYGFTRVYVARNEWEICAIGCKTDLSAEMKERIGLDGRATGTEHRPVHPDNGRADVEPAGQLRAVAELPLQPAPRRAGDNHQTAAPPTRGHGAQLPRATGLGRRL